MSQILTDTGVAATGSEPLKSVKTVVTDGAASLIYRKVGKDMWLPASLTEDEVSDILQAMTTTNPTPKKREANLIPGADVYLDNGFNLLVVGLHGTGKTESIKQLVRERGMKMKYYSCATLDPFTDLVGVPTPRDYCVQCKVYHKDQTKCPDCGSRTVESLKMVRPRDVDEAELIFFDEGNRADTKTTNAILEIVQFGTINGEPLPNLKACWMAINPPDTEENYQVEQLDPALIDRFDIYVNITPKPSVVYMAQHMPGQIAAALKAWWDDHNNAIKQGSKDAHADYISPRRLEKLGLVWCATKNPKSVKSALPLGGNFDETKLCDLLKRAQKDIDQGNDPNYVPEPDDPDLNDPDLSGNGLGDRPATQFTYQAGSMQLQAVDLSKYLRDNPMHNATHDAVVNALKQQIGGNTLVEKYAVILDALNPAKLEAMISTFPQAKTKMMKDGFMTLYKDKRNVATTLKTLHKVLDKAGGNNPTGWPTTL